MSYFTLKSVLVFMIKNINTLLIKWSNSDIEFYWKLGRTFHKLKIFNNGNNCLKSQWKYYNPQSDDKKLLMKGILERARPGNN